ncbi:hypothetical protein GOBAR_DD21792 [Gossypium barbadense]|nr:hypothetical protein GOBAR_DD21792 [Gossypium barbadense]
MEAGNKIGSTAHPTSLHPPVRGDASSGTLGRHLARRLVEIGVKDVFSVPGDFNLTLLDHLIAEPELNLVGCCNELNAGYAADGYARAKGVGACVVTFTVGGLSVLNAIAGAYSENLPVICIVGGPNSNDYGTNRILHHTIGLPDFSQELRCFQTITCAQAVVNNLDDAHELLDTAISTALKESKPVYISIGCNLPGIPHPTFARDPVPFFLAPNTIRKELVLAITRGRGIICVKTIPGIAYNQLGLEAAVEATANFLNKAVKPVLVGGPKLRVANAKDAFVELADACGYPIAVMPSGKGLVPEHHPHFIGTYWGAKDKAIIVQPNRVTIGNGPSFGWVFMADFLSALAKKLKKNTTAVENYRRIFVPPGMPLKHGNDEPLRVNVLFKHIQDMLSKDSAVIAETGDSWFNCQKLHLPENCGYEFQMQYGSIGWSVGATLGYAQAAKDKRVIACIGDGSFQVTAQDISTMIRCGQKSIIFLINNGGYTIEVEIHDGPYNVIKNWNYTAFVDAIHNGEGKCWTAKLMGNDSIFNNKVWDGFLRKLRSLHWVNALGGSDLIKEVVCWISPRLMNDDLRVRILTRRVEWMPPIADSALLVAAGCCAIGVRTEDELIDAIAAATGEKKDSLCFIEVFAHKDDTSKELLEWGSRVSSANSRPPNPQ